MKALTEYPEWLIKNKQVISRKVIPLGLEQVVIRDSSELCCFYDPIVLYLWALGVFPKQEFGIFLRMRSVTEMQARSNLSGVISEKSCRCEVCMLREVVKTV